MVKCKQQVYDWFRTLDTACRVDFVCSILERYCNPWEVRFYGTCIEQLARKDYHVLKDRELKESDYKELKEMTSRNLLHREEIKLRSRLIIWMCLLKSRPPNALCSKIFHDMLIEMYRCLQIYARTDGCSLGQETNLISDIRLLLTIAIHHPAFTFSQQQEFISQMELFAQIFGRPPSEQPSPECSDSQCQTDFETGNDVPAASISPTDVRRGGTGGLLANAGLPSPRNDTSPTQSQRQCHIKDLNLVSVNRTKSDTSYTIEVRNDDGEMSKLHKSPRDIKTFHEKVNILLREFPEDVKSPKHLRSIPLLKGAADSSDRSIQTYLKDLCKMKREFLDSALIRDFFLPGSVTVKNAKSSRTPKAGSSSRSTTTVSPVVECSGLNSAITSATPSSGASMNVANGCDALGLPMHTVIVTNSSRLSTASPASALDTSTVIQQYSITSASTSPRSPTLIAHSQIAASISSTSPTKPGATIRSISVDNQLNVPSVVQHQLRHITATPHNSPLNSPGRSTSNYSNEHVVHNLDTLTPLEVLRSLRLHKYDHLFSHSTVREMMLMSAETFKTKGMTEGGAKKLAERLDQISRNHAVKALPADTEKPPSGRPAHVFASQNSCDSSSSDVASPRTSPYVRPVSLAMSQSDVSPRQHSIIPGQAPAPDIVETRARLDRPPPPHEVQRSWSSSNLYAFPSQNNINGNLMTSSDSTNWQNKPFQKTSPQTMVSPPHQTQSEVGTVSTMSFRTQSEPNSATTKGNQRAIKGGVPNHSAQSIRTPNSRSTVEHGPKHIALSQHGEPGPSNPPTPNKWPTVQEIQRRQKEREQKQQNPDIEQLQPVQDVLSDSTLYNNSNALPPPGTCPPGPPPTSPGPLSADHQPLPQSRPLLPPTQLSMSTPQQKTVAAAGPAVFEQGFPHREQKERQQERRCSSTDPQYSDESDGFSLGEVSSTGLSAGSCRVQPPPQQQQAAMRGRPEIMAAYSNHGRGDGLPEPLEDREVSVPADYNPHTVLLQQTLPYLAGAVDPAELSYYHPQINGFKAFPINPQERESLAIITGSDGTYTSCGCAQCMGGQQFYMSMAPPTSAAPRPPSHPPVMPPQQQNGIVYGFPGAFVPTSNGLISPRLPPNLNSRPPGNRGRPPPPNGMVQRNEVMYQQMSFMPSNTSRPNYHAPPASAGSVGSGAGNMMPPQFQQLPPPNYQFYIPPSSSAPVPYPKRVIQCTNCGRANHTRTECPEPVDAYGNLNQYHLEMVPSPQEISE